MSQVAFMSLVLSFQTYKDLYHPADTKLCAYLFIVSGDLASYFRYIHVHLTVHSSKHLSNHMIYTLKVYWGQQNWPFISIYPLYFPWVSHP